MASFSQRPLFVQIRTPVPDQRRAASWGDWHFARSLAKGIQELGHYARVDHRTSPQPSWDRNMDVVLTIRGRYSKSLDRRYLNLMWLISHPEYVEASELQMYDHVFVASYPHAEALRRQTRTPVSVLSQATDTDIFFSTEEEQDPEVPRWPVLFVGNSRQQYRRMVQYCIQGNIDFALYGGMWRGLVPAHYIKGESIPNERLAQYYRNCSILLNDHWDSMRDHGFISNRLYDAGACSTLVLTDPVAGLEADFDGSHDTVRDAGELATKIRYYLANPAERERRAALARRQVEAHHTFRHRAKAIVDTAMGLLPKLSLKRDISRTSPPLPHRVSRG